MSQRETELIAACIEFLDGPGASFIAGTAIVAGGGGSAVDVGTLGFGGGAPE